MIVFALSGYNTYKKTKVNIMGSKTIFHYKLSWFINDVLHIKIFFDHKKFDTKNLPYLGYYTNCASSVNALLLVV